MIILYQSMSKRYKQFQPIVVADFEVDTWNHPLHKHNHYELIYIKRGSGTHVINKVSVDYHQGNLFLLGPEEEHYFEIKERTRFIYLKFTDLYIKQAEKGGFNAGLQHLEYLIKSRETHLSAFNITGDDQTTACNIFDVILSLKNDMLRNEQLIWMQLFTMAHLLQRNMPEIDDTFHRSKDMQAVFCYIHKHIYYPDKLRAEVMASHFKLTKDYIGPYFKRNTGLTLKNYINTYRINLIRQRVNSGNYRLKQIAAEFGLTDESHVSKLLKQH